MTQLLPLSPIEQVFTGSGAYPITMTFIYEAPLDPRLLAIGLEKVLGELPWVSSRLVAAGEESWGLALDDSQVSLEEGELVPVENREGEPVARFVLSSDGRELGASISHAVVDGFSYFQFLAAWARLTRGDRILAASREPLPQTAHEGTLNRDQVLEQCGLVWDEPRVPCASVRTARVRITRDELSAQRTEGLFDNDIIAARLWQEHGREEDGESLLSIPMDLRPLCRARRYFGCAVGFATVRLRADQVRTSSVTELAREVRSAVASFDKAAAARSLGTLEQLRRQEGRAVLDELHVRHPRAGLIVTNLTRMPLRDLDFGSGPPVDFDARSQIDYSAALFPAEDGVVDARVYLPG